MLNRKMNYSKYMHETKQQNVKNGFYIDITSDVKVVRLFAVIQDGCSKLQPAPSPSPMVEMGQKGLSMVKVAQG